MAPATDNGMFTFTGNQTLGDLVLVAEALRRSGQRPTLRFVRFHDGEIRGVAVDVVGGEESVRRTEMAVSGLEDEAPDSADATGVS